MAVVLQHSVFSDDGSNNDTSVTATGIVPAGTNRYGIVKFCWQANQTISSITWGGTNITANVIKNASHDGVARKNMLWVYYLDPPASSADVVCTLSGNAVGKTVIVEAWDGVDQATPYGDLTATADNTGGGNSDPNVLTVTATSGKIITDCYYQWQTATGGTFSQSQTLIQGNATLNHGGGANTCCVGSSYTTSDGSVDMTWDSTAAANNTWCIYAIAFNAAAAGGGGTPAFRLSLLGAGR